MRWGKCTLGWGVKFVPLMHGVQFITTQRHDGIYFVVVDRLVNAHSSILKLIIFRQLISNAYPVQNRSIDGASIRSVTATLQRRQIVRHQAYTRGSTISVLRHTGSGQRWQKCRRQFVVSQHYAKSVSVSRICHIAKRSEIKNIAGKLVNETSQRITQNWFKMHQNE